MVEFKLLMPEDFGEYAHEVEAKGWFSEALLMIEGRRFRLNFYDPTRLTQDVGAELSRSAAFFEENLIVVPQVTESAMREAVNYLARIGRLTSLTPERQNA